MFCINKLDINQPSTSKSYSFVELNLDATEKAEDSSVTVQVHRDVENEPHTSQTAYRTPRNTLIRVSSGNSLRRQNILNMMHVEYEGNLQDF